MEEKYKDGLHEVEGKPKKSKSTSQLVIYTCSLKIDIPGKTFKQLKTEVERAAYSPLLYLMEMAKANKISKISLANLKYPHRVSIKSFLQYELNNYCAKRIPRKAVRVYIKNYKEREGCIEIQWDIVADKMADATTQTLIGIIITEFYAYIKKKLKKQINPKNKLNCKISGNINKKDDITSPSDNK